MGDEDKTVKTGRFSSKNPNLQQLPARQGEDGVRMLFSTRAYEVEEEIIGNKLDIFVKDEVETIGGFVKAESLKIGDILLTDSGNFSIKELLVDGEIVSICI